MELQPPQFFKRGPPPLARLTFFGLLSVLLMVLDARFQYAEPVRHALTLIIHPLQQAATMPVKAFNHISDFFSTQTELRRDNAELRTTQLSNAEALLRLQALDAENRQLREVLIAREHVKTPATFAEIVYGGRDPFSRKVIIDKGEQHGLKLGQPVVDARGVVGQVTRVLPMLAEVTLITDKDHAIPVQVLRNGLRGIAYGSGDGSTLELRFMPTNAEIENEDLLVTSGLDGVYPPGLPVAKVSRIDRSSVSFATIRLKPIAGTEQHRQVLVLEYEEKLPPRPEPAEKHAKPAAKQRKAP